MKKVIEELSFDGQKREFIFLPKMDLFYLVLILDNRDENVEYFFEMKKKNSETYCIVKDEKGNNIVKYGKHDEKHNEGKNILYDKKGDVISQKKEAVDNLEKVLEKAIINNPNK